MSPKQSKKRSKTQKSEFVYVIYIAVKPQQLWNALTSRRFVPKYFFGRKVESSWEVGSPITFWTPEGEKDVYGEILAFEPGRLLSYTFKHPLDNTKRKKPSQVRFELLPMSSSVKLKLIHKDLMPEDFGQESDGFRGVNNGWPAILSGLKTLLETGDSLTFEI